jgi:glutamate formiminotransferase
VVSWRDNWWSAFRIFPKGAMRPKWMPSCKRFWRRSDVVLLDRESDADHNRSVLTFVGPPAAVEEAAVRGVSKAVELIDLTRTHRARTRASGRPMWCRSSPSRA